MSSGALTIHGGSGADTINFAFTVTGTNTLRYATQFANNVNALLVSEKVTFVNSTGALASAPAGGTPVYDVTTVGGAPLNWSIGSSGYVVDSIGGAATLSTDIGGGDTVLVAAINAATTVNSYGGDNEIVFVDGNNTYNGANGLAGDTVVAGSGFDTIITGGGNTTVNSGTGDATIYLNDTGAAAFNDHVWLDDGHSTVYADGTGDAIVATIGGQTIYGDAASGNLGVVLAGSGAGNDLISITGGATTTVYDSTFSGNDTIDAGTGVLYLVAGAGVTDSVNAGSGSAYIFGATGADIVLGTQAGDTGGSSYFYAGTGNETLAGGAATNNLYLFGGAAGSTDSLTGGSGNDLLVAGGGSETLTGGGGSNSFLLDATATTDASITIGDFSAGNNTLDLAGFTAADLSNILTGGTVVDGAYQVALSNGSTITFDGITSGSQLAGHIVTF